MGLVRCRNSKVVLRRLVTVFRKHVGDFLAQQTVELGRPDILISGHTLLNAVDDSQCCVDTDIRGHKDLFEVVEHIVIYRRFTGDGV